MVRSHSPSSLGWKATVQVLDEIDENGTGAVKEPGIYCCSLDDGLDTIPLVLIQTEGTVARIAIAALSPAEPAKRVKDRYPQVGWNRSSPVLRWPSCLSSRHPCNSCYVLDQQIGAFGDRPRQGRGRGRWRATLKPNLAPSRNGCTQLPYIFTGGRSYGEAEEWWKTA